MEAAELHSTRRRTNRLLAERGPGFRGNMPLHLRVSVLEGCNLRCYMCHLSNLPDEKLDELSKDRMPVPLYEELAEAAFPYAEKVTLGFAGEPTLHPEFPEFLRIAHQYGIASEVWTNGTRLHEPAVAEAIARHADWLVVSMDGSDAETYASLRGGADLESTHDGIRQIQMLAGARPRARLLSCGVHNTLMRSNIEQLPALVENARKLDIDRISASHIGIFDGNLETESLFTCKDLADCCFAKAREIAEKAGVEIDLPPTFGESDFAKPAAKGFRCYDIDHSAIVLCNGDILPCCHAASRFRLVMGNLRESALPDIWYGRRYNILRNAFGHDDLNPACLDCAGNNPFMDVSRVWELEEFSPNTADYARSLSFVDDLRDIELDSLLAQERVATSTAQSEAALDREFERVCDLEARLPQRFHLCHEIERQLQTRYKRDVVARDGTSNGVAQRANRLLYRLGRAFQGNMPLQVNVPLIAGCNIRCVMCSLAHMTEEERRALLKRRMGGEVFTKLEREVFPYVENVFFGIGGEPTLHPEFPEFVRRAAEAGPKVEVTTNGLQLRAPRIAEACASYVDSLVISMDGATKSTFEEIREGACWEELLDGIRWMVERREKTSDSPLRLAVNYTLMRRNIDEFPSIVSLAHELGIEKVTAEHLLVTDDSLAEQSLFHTPEHSDEKVLEAVERARALGMEIGVPDLFHMDSAPHGIEGGVIRNVRPRDLPGDVPYCHLLGYSAVVMPDGEVMPCSHPEAEHRFRMGSLRDEPFRDIWYDDRYQTLRHHADGSTEKSAACLPTICANCSMSGRSDGDVPRFDLPDSHLGGTLDCIDGKLPSKAHFPRQIDFTADLAQHTQELQRHIENISNVAGDLRAHELNICEILEREAAHSRRPLPIRMLRKAARLVFDRLSRH